MILTNVTLNKCQEVKTGLHWAEVPALTMITIYIHYSMPQLLIGGYHNKHPYKHGCDI